MHGAMMLALSLVPLLIADALLKPCPGPEAQFYEWISHAAARLSPRLSLALSAPDRPWGCIQNEEFSQGRQRLRMLSAPAPLATVLPAGGHVRRHDV